MGSRKNYIKTVREICEIIISKGYDDLKKEFKEVYINKRTSDAEKYGNISVEERLLNFNENSKINTSDRIILNSVIEKIKKDKYEFSNTDKEDLVFFNKKIDFAIAQCQYITNIFDGENNFVKGHSLDIITLFNDIKSSTTINDFLKNTKIDNAFIENPHFKSFLIYLFALIKNIENENKYPIYYKFYQNIAKYFFDIDLLDYDNFCVHFRETNFNTEPKLLEFNTYYYLLGENLKKELKLHDLSNEEVDKRWLKKNLFNVDADSIDSVDVLSNTIQDEFKKYLEKNVSKTSVKKYLGGISSVDKISLKIGLEDLFNWDLKDFVNNKEVLFNDEEFIRQNTSGNNMYSVAVNHYQKFLHFMEKKNDRNIPEIPFDTFGWRWASTGIASHLNQPNSLRTVLDTILINGNGANNYTLEFKTLLYSICVNKYSFTKEQAEKLTKPLKFSNNNEPITIIENSGNYWAHLGLLTKTGKNAEVSELGKKFLTGELPEDDFVSTLIDEYLLPNKAYKTSEVNKWESSKLKIYPLKLIQNIFYHLFQNYNIKDFYITESELSNIIIPCSYNIKVFDIKKITSHIIEYRKYPDNYSSWPKPQSNYTDDKGFRMANEFLYFLEVFDFLSSNKTNTVRSSDKKYIATNKFIDMSEPEKNEKPTSSGNIKTDTFSIQKFITDTHKSNLTYNSQLITRYISSLTTKPFVLLSGLSGSGKTKLAQSFSQWICEDNSQYCIVPVGADWINREPLLGYVNALNPEEYILPENGALQLIIEANNEENQNKPYFLILDEMNLSHVERYFADFLSVMESKDKFKLHSSESNLNITNTGKLEKSIEVPSTLRWPKNLFVVGTVNIDETTYMFSPKVLDRANVIEFRINETEMNSYLNEAKDVTDLNGEGKSMGESFVTIATEKTKANSESLKLTLNDFFITLQEVGAEFGYRTASEIQTLFGQIDVVNPDFKSSEDFKKYSCEDDYKIDIAIMQKLLPKLHGSRSKLTPVLKTLASLCYQQNKDFTLEQKDKVFEKVKEDTRTMQYPVSLEKITRMYQNVISNGFTSYAEA